MMQQKHLEYLKQGVKRWNQWRSENSSEQPDLEGVNLEGAVLENINFEEANLTGANLKWANLWGAHLTKAALPEADLRMADLSESHIRGANLTKADLRGAILADADLRETCLELADLSGANITGVKLYNSHLEGCIIEGVVCDYIFLDSEGSKRVPDGRNFRPKEFEHYSKHPQLAGILSSELMRHIAKIFSFRPFHRDENSHTPRKL